MRDLDKDLSDCSFLICSLRADWHCSISKALSLAAALALEREEEGAREGRERWRNDEDDLGVCLEAVKK